MTIARGATHGDEWAAATRNSTRVTVASGAECVHVFLFLGLEPPVLCDCQYSWPLATSWCSNGTSGRLSSSSVSVSDVRDTRLARYFRS